MMNKYKLAAALVLIAFASLTWSFKEDLFLISKNLDVFAALYKEININYVEETDPSDLMHDGIDAMLGGLDPYTEYVPEAEIEDYKLKYVSTQYGGIGASTLFIEGKLFINEVMEGYPADKQGLKPGDQLVRIGEVEVKGKDRAQISQLLRGPKGSRLDLLIIRDGAVLKKNVIRDEIRQPNVVYAGMTEGQVGYIRLDKFLENAAQEVKDAAVMLEAQHPKGMILDLRYNGGGILQEAVRIVNLFVGKDVVVVTQKGRNPQKTVTYRTMAEPLFAKTPLVVLIGGNSASASEIVAGALQDLDRAIIVGQRSYGKGLVQQTFNLPYNSLVKVTVAKYFTPSGRCIQATDYAHRDASGRGLKFADSVMKQFNTKTGRNVYDGNGIYPDVVVEQAKFSPVTTSILSKSLFFDYANDFRKRNKSIVPAAEFQLSDADYGQFVASMSGRDYSYVSKTEQLLSDLREEAAKENKLSVVKADLDDLREKMLGAKKTELMTYKGEIKRLLETQIVSRYYYDKGKVLQAFQYDKELAAARSLLGDQARMLAILKGEGDYKTIGSPVKTLTAAADNN